MNFIVKYPAPLNPNKSAFKVVNAETAEHAEIYVQWTFNLNASEVKAVCETNTNAEFHASADELKDLDLIKK